MRYLITILLIGFLNLPSAFAGNLINSFDFAPGGGGGGYSDILFYWGAESGTAEKSAGDATATFGSSAEVNTGIPKVGSYSLDCPTGYDTASFDISSNDILDPVSGRVGFYWYVTTYNNDGFWTASYDGNNNITFEKYGGQMAIRHTGNGTTVTLYTGFNPTADTWYFVELVWGGATNTLELFLDGVSEASTTSSLTSMTSDPTTLIFGVTTGSDSDAHYDQMLSSNDPARDLNAIKNQTSFPD